MHTGANVHFDIDEFEKIDVRHAVLGYTNELWGYEVNNHCKMTHETVRLLWHTDGLD